jgi:hypothetical protein
MDAQNQNQNPTFLDYTNQGLTELPTLPQGLKRLLCGGNYLQTLPDLPDTLEELYCDVNKLINLPPLPPGLKRLRCGGNNLQTLPDLPDTLEELYCDVNKLINLPPLPPGLKVLICDYNNLQILPDLPDALEFLDCIHNDLKKLPKFPDSLKYIYCGNNKLIKLPELPSRLFALYCDDNLFVNLPNLPENLDILNCRGNPLITELPTLPIRLFSLKCDFLGLSDAGFQKMLTEMGHENRVKLIESTICEIKWAVEIREWAGVLPEIFVRQPNDCDEYESDDEEEEDEEEEDEDDETDESEEDEPITHVIEPLPDIPLRLKGLISIKKPAMGRNIFDATEENVLEFLKKDADNIVLHFNNEYYLYDRSYLRIVPENLTYICKKAYEHGLDVTGRLKKNNKGGYTIYFSMRKLGLYGIVPAHKIKQIIETKHQFFSIESKTPEKRAPSTASYEVFHNIVDDVTSRSHCQEGQGDTIYTIYRFDYEEEIEKKRKRSTSASKERSASQTRKRTRSASASKERSPSQTRKRTRSASASKERSPSQTRKRSRGGNKITKKSLPIKKTITPLKISIRRADETSTKLPVTV